MTWSHVHFHWNELMTRDVARAKKFYADTLGWSFDSMPIPGDGSYTIALADGEPVGGISDINGPEYEGVPEGWMSYIAVDDVDACVKRATRAGAKIVTPAFDVPDVGRIVILTEPGGASIGWMTPAS
jgi:predicted enzyme related to lactoylglutathione lyase